MDTSPENWGADCWDVAAGRTADTCCKLDVSEFGRFDGHNAGSGTSAECWGERGRRASFEECCTNADCWTSGFSYDDCCGVHFGAGGNPLCWSGHFTYDVCCQARGSIPWVEEFFASHSHRSLYTVESFYTDAQYGPDFGYYSTGRVLRGGRFNRSDGGAAVEFAHFTTFPMALEPHFGRHICRLLFMAWLSLQMPPILRVIELGAGSGQLGVDIARCVRQNEIGMQDTRGVVQAWQSAMRYTVVERSPALAGRQRRRGLRVVQADAQDPSLCPQLRRRLRAAESVGKHAVGLEDASDAPGVLISNELIDSFAPARLRMGIAIDDVDFRQCGAWQEIRVVHVLDQGALRDVLQLAGVPEPSIQHVSGMLAETTDQFACGAVHDTSIGRAAERAVLSDLPCWSGNGDHDATSCCRLSEYQPGCWAQGRTPELCCSPPCLPLFLAVASLPFEQDLRLPMSAHEFRRRIRLDSKARARLRKLVGQLRGDIAPSTTLLMTAEQYRQLRRLVVNVPVAEIELLRRITTRKVVTPLEAERCDQVQQWVGRHEARLLQEVPSFLELGYSSIDLLLRFGEEGYGQLADCLLPGGGYVLTVDYGAAFAPMLHATAVSGEDNIVPPMYDIPSDSPLPDCHSEWTRCAGLIDWTTGADFTNLAAAGEQLGWRTVYYGPQSALEQITPLEIPVAADFDVQVPGYFTAKAGGYPRPSTTLGRFASNWYGRILDGGQRWHYFKALLQFKAPGYGNEHLDALANGTEDDTGATESVHQRDPEACKNRPARLHRNQLLTGQLILAPPFPLGYDDLNPCWMVDATNIPVADQIRLAREAGRPAGVVVAQAQQSLETLERMDKIYADVYEDLQLAARLTDWLVAKHGCRRTGDGTWRVGIPSFNDSWSESHPHVWPPWVKIWGLDRLRRVGAGLLRTLRDGIGFGHMGGASLRVRPFECAAEVAGRRLCGTTVTA